MYKIQDIDNTRSLFNILKEGETEFSLEVIDDCAGADFSKKKALTCLINAVYEFVYNRELNDELLLAVYNATLEQLSVSYSRSSFAVCNLNLEAVVAHIKVFDNRY